MINMILVGLLCSETQKMKMPFPGKSLVEDGSNAQRCIKIGQTSLVILLMPSKPPNQENTYPGGMSGLCLN